MYKCRKTIAHVTSSPTCGETQDFSWGTLTNNKAYTRCQHDNVIGLSCALLPSQRTTRCLISLKNVLHQPCGSLVLAYRMCYTSLVAVLCLPTKCVHQPCGSLVLAHRMCYTSFGQSLSQPTECYTSLGAVLSQHKKCVHQSCGSLVLAYRMC